MVLAAWSLGLGSGGVVRAAGEAGSPFAACERLLLSPGARDHTLCFHNTAQRHDLWDDARRRLAGLRAAHPDVVWMELAHGHLERPFDVRRAEALFGSAAERFARDGEPEGELLARANLRLLLAGQGRTGEARAELDRALHVARTAREPRIVARGLILEASDRLERSDDLGRAWRLLKRAEGMVFPSGPDGLKRQCLGALASASGLLGRLDEAQAAYERLGELARETGDPSNEARARFSSAHLAYRRLTRLPTPGARERTLALAREALAASERARHHSLTAMSLRLVADVLPRDPAGDAEAAGALQRCLVLARQVREPERRISCTATLARRLAIRDPPRALRLAREALRDALTHGDPAYVAETREVYLAIGWRTQPRKEMLLEGRRALDAAEVVRELQGDALSRAEVFADWAATHRRFAGLLLQSDGEGERPDRAEAFAVFERLRARSLAEELQSARVSDGGSGDAALQAERTGVLQQLTAVQRRLLDAGAPSPDRARALRERRSLELHEQELRAALRRPPAPGGTPSATLDDIERTLDADEAMLSFQLGLWEDYSGEFQGGAWLLVSTRLGTRVFRLPGRERLEPALPVLIGLFPGRNGSEAAAAASLHRLLLAPALGSLPQGIRRLVIVPDGALHNLPFAALRTSANGAPLATRYELVLAPSAALWHQWRKTGRTDDPAGGVLAFADPGTTDVAGALVTGETPGGAAVLGPLPGARREARAAVRRARGKGRLLSGQDASEHALRTADLRPFGVLHFAAHAVADQEEPERTSVVLAPGAPEHDGLLQVREIAELDLSGRLVVLSACRSAAGPVLGGEGAMSLARAFFQAGATSVVASLWPLRDDETSWLMERFYGHLGRGLTASAALRAAQTDAWQAQFPAAAWSGLVLLGEGSVRPLTGPEPGWIEERWRAPATVGILAGLATAAAAALWYQRRRARRLAQEEEVVP